MQGITIYTTDRDQPIAVEVGRITGGYSQTALADLLGFEDAAGEKGRIYINKDQVIAVVISPPLEGDAA